jgi:RecA-family ATPase
LQKRLRQILAGLDLHMPASFFCHTEWNRQSEGGLDDIRRWIEERDNPRLIVIDTLARFRDRHSSRSNNAYQEDYDAIVPLQKLAEECGVAILIIGHTRKFQSEDYLDNVGGTTGITAAVDTVLVLSRKRTENRITLEVTGRDIEQEEKLDLVFNPEVATYVLAQSDPGINEGVTPDSPAWNRVEHYLDSARGFRTIAQIAEGIGKSKNDLQSLRKLVQRYKKLGCVVMRGDAYALPKYVSEK